MRRRFKNIGPFTTGCFTQDDATETLMDNMIMMSIFNIFNLILSRYFSVKHPTITDPGGSKIHHAGPGEAMALDSETKLD